MQQTLISLNEGSALPGQHWNTASIYLYFTFFLVHCLNNTASVQRACKMLSCVVEFCSAQVNLL